MPVIELLDDDVDDVAIPASLEPCFLI